MADNGFITITNEDIYRELQEIKTLGIKTHEQACKTNGRVSALESKSIGLWVSKHPVKFTGYTLVFLSVFLSEIREPILSLVKAFLLI